VRVERSFLIPGLVFVTLAAASVTYSLLPVLTLQRTLSMAFVIVALGLGLPNYLATETRLNLAIRLVIVLMGGLVLLGSIGIGGVGDVIFQESSYLRLRGVFGNPNTQGLISMLVFYPLVWWWRTESNRGRRAALGLLACAWAVLVVLAGSRASFLGLVGGAVILLWLYGRTSRRYSFVLVLVVVSGLVLESQLPAFSRAFMIRNDERAAASMYELPVVDRPYLIRRGIELGMRSPVWGVGFTASDRVFEQDRPYLISQGVYVSGSHNSYVRLFVDLGVVGLIFGLSIFVLVLGRVLVAPTNIRRDTTVALMTAAVTAGLTNAFFEGWLFGFGNSSTLPFWFFLAVIPIRMSQLRTPPPGDPLTSAPQTVQAKEST
jgi:O-antigen ligase